MRMRFHKVASVLLMVLGAVMLARGLDYTIQSGMGWQGIIQASIAGGLVFALGFTRWRYLRQR
jgi:uncharacterized protein (DUF697 family)